jgi:hypothetical protein
MLIQAFSVYVTIAFGSGRIGNLVYQPTVKK